MNLMRSVLQFGVSVVCLGLVAGGLVMSLGTTGEGVLLNKPGEPGRLNNNMTSATAFFQIDGDMLELTMLFTEPDDPNSVSKSHVRLTDGQSHTIVVGSADNSGVTRFIFRRIGYAVEMRLAEAATLNASLGSWN